MHCPQRFPEIGERLPLLASLLLAISLAGCGDSSEPVASEPSPGLELTPVGDPLTVRQPLELVRWEAFDESEGFDGWTVQAAKHEVITFREEQVLRLIRREDVRIEIPVELCFSGDGQLRISMFAQSEPYELKARMMKGGAEVVAVSFSVKPWVWEQENVLRFPGGAEGEWNVDRIILEIPKGAEANGLVSITVEDVPFGGYFPEGSFGGYSLIELGTESRRAACLSSSTPMEARFSVTDPGQELRFSYSMPEEVRVSASAPELNVTLRSGAGHEEVHTFAFERGSEEPATWHSARIPLDALVGEELTATVALPAAGAAERICALGRLRLATSDDDPPTVLLITSDTHRSDHLGFLSEKSWLRTDAIDQLASEGVVFTDALASINNTTPSHVSLFTGLTPRDTGIITNLRRLSDQAPTLAEKFSELGYATIATVSASPVNYRFCGLGQGFDHYSTPGTRTWRGSVQTLRELYAWLPDYQGVPLFVWVHIYDAHSPYRPPVQYERMYYPVDADPYDTERPGADPSIAPGWNDKIADPQYTEALYRSEITFLDEQLGKLLSRPRFQKGMVAFTADHGEVLSRGKDRLFNHEGLSFDTLAVPLILKAPGIPAGTRRAASVRQIDIGRTLLNLIGHPEVEFPGRDLLEQTGEQSGPRFAIEANGTSASVISRRWMLQLALRPPKPVADASFEKLHEVILFNLETDPHCEQEVRDEHPERTAKLRASLVRWLLSCEQQNWEVAATVPNQDVEQHLADLGYVSAGTVGVASQWIDPECDCEWCTKFE